MPSCGPSSTWPTGRDVGRPGLRLAELRVRDLGVIDDVTVTFTDGMTALTGETGAGKTLLVEAIGLLLGGRADPGLIRAGSDEALVEGRFVRDPSDSGGHDTPGDPGASDEVVLARAVVRGGRSKAFVDGRMASLAVLTETAAGLIELHGQHQHRSLVHPDAQRGALDAFGRIDLGPLEAARLRERRLRDECRALGGDARARAREADLLTYQLEEIDAAAIDDTEEDRRLETEEDRLAQAALHRHAAAEALALVSGEDPDGVEDASALDRLALASRSLAGAAPLAPLESRLRSVMVEVTELGAELRTVVETWEDDPARLEAVRTRRQVLHQLQRKYGTDLGEVMDFATDVRRRLADLRDRELRAVELDAELDEAHRALRTEEAAVAAARREAAPRMATEIEATLHRLAMPSARFSIAVEGDGAADRVTMTLGANAGEPLQPLARVASGGELARTMLAVRLATTDRPGVMVFDEVDAGIGGTAASTVGAALADLGRHVQVLVVTHLAQVASQAASQIRVHKAERSGRTRTEVVTLDTEGRVVELSRMLSGRPDSDSARRHARELLRQDPAPAAPAAPA